MQQSGGAARGACWVDLNTARPQQRSERMPWLCGLCTPPLAWASARCAGLAPRGHQTSRGLRQRYGAHERVRQREGRLARTRVVARLRARRGFAAVAFALAEQRAACMRWLPRVEGELTHMAACPAATGKHRRYHAGARGAHSWRSARRAAPAALHASCCSPHEPGIVTRCFGAAASAFLRRDRPARDLGLCVYL